MNDPTDTELRERGHHFVRTCAPDWYAMTESRLRRIRAPGGSGACILERDANASIDRYAEHARELGVPFSRAWIARIRNTLAGRAGRDPMNIHAVY